jgi:serine/threonine protein kinase
MLPRRIDAIAMSPHASSSWFLPAIVIADVALWLALRGHGDTRGALLDALVLGNVALVAVGLRARPRAAAPVTATTTTTTTARVPSSVTAAPPRSGERAGRYQLGALIGRGGMGEVYEARDAGGDAVAVKVPHPRFGADAIARARFRREAALVRRLPRTVTAHVREVGTTATGADYIAMERLTGLDLGALLRRVDRLGPVEAAALIGAIARAIGVAHDAGIVHLDLKPSNVFLVDGALDDVRILDFGIARMHALAPEAAPVETAVVLGSPGYLPPEQIFGGHARIGPAADVFALGAIAYRAITGVPAFPARDPAAAIDEALHHVPAPPSRIAPELPAGVDAVLAIALAKDQAARYPRAPRFAADLARALAGDPMLDLERAVARARAHEDVHTLSEGEAERGHG